ncbi:MAG TPA: hypothetical protein VMW91_02275 [Desulfosporosinus sp.]|nr:hypothetical protein [Desulfosporosinus sp.]
MKEMELSHKLLYSDRKILHMVCRDRCGAPCNDFYVEECPEGCSHCYHCKDRFYPFVIEMFPVKEVVIDDKFYLEIMGAHIPKEAIDNYVRVARHRARTEQYFKDLPKEEKCCWNSQKMDWLQHDLHREIVQHISTIDYYNDMARPVVALRAILEHYVDEQTFTKDGKVRKG